MSEQSLMYIELRGCLRLAVGAVLVCAVSACSPQPPKEEAKVVLVTTARPPEDPATVIIGSVRAAQAHDVPAQNGGRVEKLLVDVGTSVRAGQDLAVLENRAETLRLLQAAAEVQRLSAVAEERRINFKRMASLMQAAAISQSAYDSAKSDSVSSARAVEVARQAQALARRDLSLTVVRAPVDGIVASRLIKLSDQVAAGAVMFEIDGKGVREIVANAPDAVTRNLHPGDALRFRGDAGTGTARVTSVGERVQGYGSREIRLEIILGNSRPGTVVEVLLASSSENTASALVPATAIVQMPGARKTAFVVGKDNRLRAVSVSLRAIGSAGALIAGDVAPGEQVVAAGAAFLRSGMLVKPVSTPR